MATLFDIDSPLRALTVRQPWASLIMAGVKDVENRTWTTLHRGVLVIHAGQGVDKVDFAHNLGDLPGGVILGTVRVVDCVRGYASRWAEDGCWHWVLTDPRPLPLPVVVAGKLGLWRLDDQTTCLVSEVL